MNPENNQNQNQNQPGQNTSSANPQAVLPPKHNTLMAVLAYIGPLVLVSYFTSREDSFVKFHIKQGLVLFTIEVALWVLSGIIWMLWPIVQIIHIAIIILAIIGIVNAVKGREKELPLVGKFAQHFKV
jgi:uncharacterized membrane protein